MNGFYSETKQLYLDLKKIANNFNELELLYLSGDFEKIVSLYRGSKTLTLEELCYFLIACKILKYDDSIEMCFYNNNHLFTPNNDVFIKYLVLKYNTTDFSHLLIDTVIQNINIIDVPSRIIYMQIGSYYFSKGDYDSANEFYNKSNDFVTINFCKTYIQLTKCENDFDKNLFLTYIDELNNNGFYYIAYRMLISLFRKFSIIQAYDDIFIYYKKYLPLISKFLHCSDMSFNCFYHLATYYYEKSDPKCINFLNLCKKNANDKEIYLKNINNMYFLYYKYKAKNDLLADKYSKLI